MSTAPQLTHRQPLVLIIPRDEIEYPGIYSSVYIEDSDPGFNRLLVFSKCTREPDPLKADFVIFTGGQDVDPELYDHKRHPKTGSKMGDRDERCIDLYVKCVENGIPMVGVCRGAQFLHVMNGGTLYQHVTGHCGTHDMIDVRDNKHYRITSTHHQMLKFNDRMELIGVAVNGTAGSREEFPKEGLIEEKSRDMKLPQVEACYYPETNSLCIQGHPEYAGVPEFTAWSLQLILDTALRSVHQGGNVWWPQDPAHPRYRLATTFDSEGDS